MDWKKQIIYSAKLYFEPLQQWKKKLIFLWIVTLATVAKSLDLEWGKLTWLCPKSILEHYAEQVHVVDGVVYSIVPHQLPKKERDMFENADVSEHFKKHILRQWYCGYVRYPECPLLTRKGNMTAEFMREQVKRLHNSEELDEIPPVWSDYLPVHGGVTYEREDVAGYVYGFDCNHLGDEEIPVLNDPEWLFNEIHNMRLAIDIAKNEGFEQQYLLRSDREARAIIIDKYHQRLKADGIEFDITNNFNAMINVMVGKI